jgi:adenosylmethionine---8-amino-7-oxononanoate aminotransferase
MTPELIALEQAHVWHPFTAMQAWNTPGHTPLQIVRGTGCTLYDDQGHAYLDGNASIWTNIHGHAHPRIDAAIRDQLDRIAHSSFLGLTHEPAIRLAKALVDLFPPRTLTRVFYSDNGSTAIECAVRMALQFWQQEGQPQRTQLATFDRAYHGDTLGAASLGGLPLMKGSGNQFGYHVHSLHSLPDLRALDSTQLAAVVIEPLIQGAAGMRLWPKGMLRELHTWCRQHDVLLILDEVMTGFGRTGKMFACEHESITPDFIALAKGITGGYLPLAATLTTERVFASFLPPANTFYYGHSYTANALGCAAALASLSLFQEGLINELPAKVAAFTAALAAFHKHPRVKQVRQCGLIAGIELRDETLVGPQVCLAARAHGLLTRPVLNTLVLMPPLIASADEMQRMATALLAAIEP